jgi:predicted RNase H-like HicB family nuclease
MHTYHFTAQIERDSESGMYIGIIPSLPGAHTQALRLDDLHNNLKEVVELCLEELSEDEREALPEFVGIQHISVAV